MARSYTVYFLVTVCRSGRRAAVGLVLHDIFRIQEAPQCVFGSQGTTLPSGAVSNHARHCFSLLDTAMTALQRTSHYSARSELGASGCRFGVSLNQL